MIQTTATIRRASALLHQHTRDAEYASPGIWEISPEERVIRCADESIVADRSCADPGTDIDLPYIAMMQPRVGRALLSLLNAAIEHIEQDFMCCDQGAHRCADYGAPALALAHALLGEES